MSSVAELTQKLGDPAIQQEFKALPEQDRHDVEQQILGKIIIDADMQQLLTDDPTGATDILNRFSQKYFPKHVEQPSKEPMLGLQRAPAGMGVAGPKLPYYEQAFGEPYVNPEQPALQAGVNALKAVGAAMLPETVGGAAAMIGGGPLFSRGITKASEYLVSKFPTLGRSVADIIVGARKVSVKEREAVLAKAVEEHGEPLKKEVEQAVKLEQPAEVPSAKPDDLMQPVLKAEKLAQVKTEALPEIANVLETEAAKSGQRISKQFVEAVRTGLIDVSSVRSIQERTGMSLTEVSEQFLSDVRLGAQTMNVYSQFKKALTQIAKDNPEAQKALALLEKEEPPTTLWQHIKDLYIAVDTPRRKLMVGQIATGMRNMLSQGVRYGTEMMDVATEDTLKKMPMFRADGETAPKSLERASQLATSFIGALKPASREKLLNVLEHFPIQKEAMMSSYSGELTLSTKFYRLVNWLNIAQENFFRRAAFDATMRTSLKAAGMNVEQTLANPTGIPPEMIEKSVTNALEMTFANPPQPGTLGRAIISMYNAVPMLTTVNPYPRFWGNAMQFVAEHNPLGFVRLAWDTKTPKSEVIAKAITGTVLFSAAVAARESGIRGSKWYQLKSGDQEIDTRAYSPFSTFLFLADVADVMAKMGVDTVKDGKTLSQALAREYNYTTQDVVQGVLNMNRIAGSGLVAIELARSGSMDSKLNLIRDFMAQYLGGYTVPIRSLKDMVAGVSEEEAKIRDVREDVLGPTKSNIPGVSQTLPEKPSPIQAEQPKTEHPIARQLTGLSIRTENVVEAEMSKHGIEFAKVLPATGDPEVDREVAKRMGPLVEKQVVPLIQSPLYKGMEPEVQRFVFSKALMQQRANALKLLKDERKDLASRLKVQHISADIKLLLQAMGVKDLEEALK